MLRIPSSKEVHIALHDFGGEGAPLLICHATGMNATAYRPMARRLAEDFRVWGLDFRGHGSSTKPADGDFAWSNLVDDVLAAVEHLGGGPVLAFGHSLGGCVTLLAEARRPGTIAAAYLYEPIVFPFPIGRRNSMMADNARKRRSEFPSRAAALERYASRPPLDVFRADALLAYVEGGFLDTDHGTVELACRPEHEAAVFENANTHVDAIRDVTIPVLVAAGQAVEHPSPAEFALGTAEALPAGRHVQYDLLAHFGPFQDPDRIGADAADFLLTAAG